MTDLDKLKEALGQLKVGYSVGHDLTAADLAGSYYRLDENDLFSRLLLCGGDGYDQSLAEFVFRPDGSFITHGVWDTRGE